MNVFEGQIHIEISDKGATTLRFDDFYIWYTIGRKYRITKFGGEEIDKNFDSIADAYCHIKELPMDETFKRIMKK